VNGSIVRCEDLTPADLDRMHELLDAHFEGVTRGQFQHDLKDKAAAALIRDEHATILGFSTLAAYRSQHARGLAVICSGDTIVDARARSSPLLAQTWIRAARALAADLHCPRAVWLLIVSGFRTYRFLPVFWKHFTPSPDQHTDDQTLLNLLATERYGRFFDPATGIVYLPNPQRLRPHLAQVPPGRDHDPHIQTFLRLNPNHAAGDELACLCDLADDNLTPAGRRMVYGARPEPIE
jgi:hypothetical protein